jgi:hypothetical protein
VLRRTLPVVLVVVAALADAASAAGLAFYALVVAVPFAALASLGAYGELIDAREGGAVTAGERVQAVLWPVALALIVLGAAARAPALAEHAVPRFGSTAMLACLLVFLVQAVAAGFAFFREPRVLERDRGSRLAR